MPQWYFFAFNPKKVADALLQPTHYAIQHNDLALWQRSYDLLNKSHYPPQETGFAYNGIIIENFNAGGTLSRDNIPERTSHVLSKCLQTFVELVSPHRLMSRCTRVRNQVVHTVSWEKILSSSQEVAQIQMFRSEIVASERQPMDPFWCLAANDATDANYIAPVVVAMAAEAEAKVGLFKNLARRGDLDAETKMLAQDLAAVSLLIELAANLGLALYFREDGT